MNAIPASSRKNYTSQPSHFWLLMALLAFVLLSRLGAAPIYILDEAKNAQCAREMLQRNDWVVPTFNGELRTDKPVLHYYFMMLAYKVFGVNAFAARFFSAVLGLCTVGLTFTFAKRFISVATAIFSMVVLIASTHFLFEFRMSVPDPYLIFFITAGLFAGYTYLQQGKLLYLLLAAASFGLATLAKGPVALALPGLCLLVWVAYRKQWNRVFTWKILLALVVWAGITLPWYLAVHKATNGAWTNGFFVEHNLNRFSDPQEGHGGFFLLPSLFVVIGLLPFTSFVGQAVQQRKMLFSNDLVKFSGIVVLAFVIFFSLSSTKLPNYPMPCYPFAAIILGHLLANFATGVVAIKKYPVYVLLVFMTLLPVAGYLAVKSEAEAAAISWVVLILLAGTIGFVVVLAKWRSLQVYLRIFTVMAAWTVFNIMALHTVYPILYSQNPVQKTLPLVIGKHAVFAYEIYNPGYNFYLQTNVRKFYQVDSLRAALEKNPDAIVITRTEFSAVLKPLHLQEVARHHDLFETPTTILYVQGEEPKL
jgi:4-amino-4-deoxy-L-arabinose transferase-like glycosyltransferase